MIQKAAALNLHPKIEITVEANPEELSLKTIKKLKQAGVNRLSIGVQSFDDDLLSLLGRTHSSQKAKEALLEAHGNGLTNLTIDLMTELPHQTLASFEKTLQEATSLPISHLSLYNLTFEPGTVFKKKEKLLKLHLPKENEALQILEKAVFHLEQNGLKRYEISAFAKEGYEAVHNTGYWTGRPFMGFGPSAFNFYEGRRFRNACNLRKYYDLLTKNEEPIDFEETLPYPANQHELLTIQLRLKRGVNIRDFSLPPTALKPIADLKKEGLLEEANEILRLTSKGALFYDSVAETLIY